MSGRSGLRHISAREVSRSRRRARRRRALQDRRHPGWHEQYSDGWPSHRRSGRREPGGATSGICMIPHTATAQWYQTVPGGSYPQRHLPHRVRQLSSRRVQFRAGRRKRVVHLAECRPGRACGADNPRRPIQSECHAVSGQGLLAGSYDFWPPVRNSGSHDVSMSSVRPANWIGAAGNSSRRLRRRPWAAASCRSGTVNYNGKPIPGSDSFHFRGQQPRARTSGAQIIDGKYKANSRGGVPVGTTKSKSRRTPPRR